MEGEYRHMHWAGQHLAHGGTAPEIAARIPAGLQTSKPLATLNLGKWQGAVNHGLFHHVQLEEQQRLRLHDP